MIEQDIILEKIHPWPKTSNNEKSGILMRIYCSANTLTVRGLFLLSVFFPLQFPHFRVKNLFV